MRTEVLPANLLQAQRDYFGAHTYERIDKPRGDILPYKLDRTRWIDRRVYLQRLKEAKNGCTKNSAQKG